MIQDLQSKSQVSEITLLRQEVAQLKQQNEVLRNCWDKALRQNEQLKIEVKKLSHNPNSNSEGYQ